jgi:hypothetical protein
MVSKTTTLYLRGMPVDVVREAKAAAARRGATLATVVTDALAGYLEGGSSAGGDDLRASSAWYEQNKQRLLRKYEGQYIAIVDGGVVDHDPDFEALASRVFARFGSRSILMPRVVESPRALRLRSPHRIRA